MVRPIVVAESERKAGKNQDGTDAEDMSFGDGPRQKESSPSAKIRSDPLFGLSDQDLNEKMIRLIKATSVGKLQTVALEMQKKFASGSGGTYRSAALDQAVKSCATFSEYHRRFQEQLDERLFQAGYDPAKLQKFVPASLDFSSLWDKASGLGITIHQVWSLRVEVSQLLVYPLPTVRRNWSCRTTYTLYDDFGLDWEDVVKNGDRTMPAGAGEGFKAWYILQHYRKAAPFITEVVVKCPANAQPFRRTGRWQ